MKRLAIIVLAACSSKKQPPPPPPPPAPAPTPAPVPMPPKPTMKSSQPIDLPDAGISQLQLIPTVTPGSARKGEFDVRWKSAKKLESGVVCRVESYNLAFFSMPDTDDSLAEGEHSVFWHPDPFVVDPEVCEVRFGGTKTLASACYRAGTMTAGPCPAGTFPPPKMDPGQTFDVQGATVTAIKDQYGNRSSIGIKAMYTVAAPVDDVAFVATCDGVTSKPETAGDLVPLHKLHAGETLYAWELSLLLPKPLTKDRPDKCELRASSKGKPLGTFCIAEGETDRGPCPK